MDDRKGDIEVCLDRFWDEMAIELGEDPLDTSGLLGAPLDSITAVEVLLELDKLLDRKIRAEVVIRKGGYESKEQFIELLTTEVLKYVEEHPRDQ